MINAGDKFEFGFPDFAETIFGEYGPALQLAYTDSHLANEMLGALPKEMKFDELVIYMLVRMTTTGWVELLILVGNGAGIGAMKIARGMFETAVMAEYLRQTPAEIEDYLQYGRVLDLKRMKLSPELFSAEQKREIEAEYNTVAPRFTNKEGRVRNHWNKNPIGFMAAAIGRRDQYEMPYSLAASIHHGNFEALIGHLSRNGETLDIDQPPSLAWVNQALVSGHVYLLQALDTLNDFFKLGFDSRIKQAGEAFRKVWSKPKS
jgi:hypothetical protein